MRTWRHLVGDGGLLDRDLQQGAAWPASIVVALELLPVHLAEALQPLELLLVVGVLGLEERALAASSFR
jgi:hypothetical protein